MSCLELHGLLDKKEEQLVEPRIALESVLLADDGRVGEKRHRLATRGAWLPGETFEERKAFFRRLREVRKAWGKFDESSGCFHRLEHHCADVAACFEAVLRDPVLRARFIQLPIKAATELRR